MKEQITIICKAAGAFGIEIIVTPNEVRFRTHLVADWALDRDTKVSYNEIASVAYTPGEGNYGGYIHLVKLGDEDKPLPSTAMEASNSLERCLCFTSDKNREFKIVKEAIEEQLAIQRP